MKFYRNMSVSPKTFHGVTFNPGEVRGVDGNINDPKMINVKGLDTDRKKPVPIGPQSKASKASGESKKVNESKEPQEAQEKGDKQ